MRRNIINKRQKNKIIKNMSYLEDAARYLLRNCKSVYAQSIVEHKKKYNGYYIELESPNNGKTQADWIRLCYEDCYLFLHNDGTLEYQYDPNHEYGGEVLTTYSYPDFVEGVMKLR